MCHIGMEYLGIKEYLADIGERERERSHPPHPPHPPNPCTPQPTHLSNIKQIASARHGDISKENIRLCLSGELHLVSERRGTSGNTCIDTVSKRRRGNSSGHGGRKTNVSTYYLTFRGGNMKSRCCQPHTHA